MRTSSQSFHGDGGASETTGASGGVEVGGRVGLLLCSSGSFSLPRISSRRAHSVGSSAWLIDLGISPFNHLFMVFLEWPVRLRIPRMETPCSWSA